MSLNARSGAKLIDVPWGTMNQSWNAKELEATKLVKRQWRRTQPRLKSVGSLIVHRLKQEKPRIATMQKAEEKVLLPLAALGGKW